MAPQMGASILSQIQGLDAQGDKDFGFKRDRTMFEVYEDLLERVDMNERFFCPRIHGKRLVLCQSSCYVFRKDMPLLSDIRYWCLWITEWRWFERIIVFAITVNSLVLALPAAYNPADASEGAKDFLMFCNLLSMFLFTVECMLKIIARGFLFSSDAPDAAYLRDPLNWLDFVVVCTSMLELYEMAQSGGGEHNQMLVLVRSFRVLRPLRSIHQLPHLRMIISALAESGHLLGHWVTIQCFFFTVLAILGDNMFSTLSWNQCRLTEQPIRVNGTIVWPIDPEQPRLCGGRYECREGTWCGSPVSAEKGKLYDYDVWTELDSNPVVDYGFNGFQSFQSALLTVFQVSTMDGWSSLLYRFQDGGGTFMSIIFFTVVVLVGGFLLMNLVVAILWERLSAVIHRERLRQLRASNEAPVVLDADIEDMRLHTLVRHVGDLDKRKAAKDKFKALDGIENSGGIRQICLTISISPTFQNLFLVIIICNAAILACDSYPVFHEQAAAAFEQVNILFTFAFCIEIVIKILGLGVDFVADQMNIFDLVLVVVSLLELASSGQTSMSALRTARVLRIFRLLGENVSVKVLLRVLQKAVLPTYNFLVLVFLVIYCLSLLGLQLFFQRADEDTPTTLGFTDLLWSAVTVFTLLIGNDWFSRMIAFARMHVETGISSTPNDTLIFFLTGFVIGNLILRNLFLGIFVASFSQAREELLTEYRQRLMNHRHPPPEEPKEEVKKVETPTVDEKDDDGFTLSLDSPRWKEDMLGRKLLFIWQTGTDMFSDESSNADTGPGSNIPECQIRPRNLDAYVTRKTGASDMNYFRMMRVKQDAMARRRALGETLTFKADDDGWRLPNVLPIKAQSEVSSEPNKRTVNFSVVPSRSDTQNYASERSGKTPKSDRETPMSNGHTNGHTHFHMNGHTNGNGHMNGHTNGNGYDPYANDHIIPGHESFQLQHKGSLHGELGNIGTRSFYGEGVPPGGAGMSATSLGSRTGLGSMESPNVAERELGHRSYADVTSAQRKGKELRSEGQFSRTPPPLVLEVREEDEEESTVLAPAPLSARLSQMPSARHRSAWSRGRRKLDKLDLNADSLRSASAPLKLDLEEDSGPYVGSASPSADPAAQQPPKKEAAAKSSRDPWVSCSELPDGLPGGLRRRHQRPALPAPRSSFREMVDQAKARLAAEEAQEPAGAAALPPQCAQLALPQPLPLAEQDTQCSPHPCWEEDFEATPHRSAPRYEPDGIFAAKPPNGTAGSPDPNTPVSPPTAKTPTASRHAENVNPEDDTDAAIALVAQAQDELLASRSYTAAKLLGMSPDDIVNNEEPEVGGIRGIAEFPLFDPFVLFLIVLSSFCLALESPMMRPSSTLAKMLSIIEKALLVFFVIEMGIRMFAYGIIKPAKNLPPTAPPPYFRIGWNWIDFFVVITGVVDVIMQTLGTGGGTLHILRALRVIRVLRPLRLVTKYKGVRIIVESIIASVPTLFNLVMICSLYYLGWGILFVNLMKGALWRCSLDPHGNTMPDIETREDCTLAGGTWINVNANFDNVGRSLVTLLHVGTGEGWIDVMLNVISSRGIDMTPLKDESFHLGILVIIFVSVSNFFIMNLFIGVLVDHYVLAKDEINGEDLLSLEEKRWKDMQTNIFLTPKLLESAHSPLAGTHMLRLRQAMQWTIETKAFECTILLVIIANTILLCIQHPTADEEFRDLSNILSVIFVMIYNFEAALKIFVYWKNYFSKPWDVFDFVVVVASDLSIIASLADLGPIAMILRSFRVGRVLRLARWVGFLRVMVNTLATIIPGLFNVVCLLCLIIFMFACLGVGLFGTLKDGAHLGENANFHTFGSAVLLLMRVSTGERWHELMYDTTLKQPNCTIIRQTPEMIEAEGFNGCGSWVGYMYFLIFFLIVGVVLINLIVAVVLDGFSSVHQFEVLKIFRVQIAELVKEWRRRDYPWTGFLELDVVVEEILLQLPPPIGFKGARRKHVLHQMRFMRMHEGRTVHFRDIVALAAQRSYLWMCNSKESLNTTVMFDDATWRRWEAYFDTYYQVDGIQAEPYPPGDEEGNDLLIAHVIIAAHVMRFVTKKRKQWRLRDLESKAEEEERMKAGRRFSLSGGMVGQRPLGAGVGDLDDGQQVYVSEAADPEAEPPSLLLTQTEMPRAEQMPQLSPLPWPPPFAQPKKQAAQQKTKTKEQTLWSSALQTAKAVKRETREKVKKESSSRQASKTQPGDEFKEHRERREGSKDQARANSKGNGLASPGRSQPTSPSAIEASPEVAARIDKLRPAPLVIP